MLARKEDVVKRLTDGVEYLFKKNRITLVNGEASLKGATLDGLQQVEVQRAYNLNFANGDQQPLEAPKTLVASKVLLATGSEPVPLPAIPFDGTLVVSAKEALGFEQVPEHLVVAGGGYIGLELGSVWRRLGARVTVLEMLPNLLPNMDRQAADTLQQALKKQGMEFKLGVRVSGCAGWGAKGWCSLLLATITVNWIVTGFWWPLADAHCLAALVLKHWAALCLITAESP